MVAVTRRGVVKNIRRVSSSRVKTSSAPAASSAGSATIALPTAGSGRSLRLEDYPAVGRRKVYLVDEPMWLHLLTSGWRIREVDFAAAHRLVDSDPSAGIDIYEVDFFSRDVVLERRRRFGSREYVDVVRVRIPWSGRVSEQGWEWLSVPEERR